MTAAKNANAGAVTFGDLPGIFEDLEERGRIDQRCGYVMAASFGIRKRFEKCQIYKTYRRFCKACFAGHVAALARTRPHTEAINTIAVPTGARASYRQAGISFAKFHGWRDGARHMAGLMAKHGADYADWARQRGIKAASQYTLEAYLARRCGAPDDCFGNIPWRDTVPSKVVRQMLALNPGLADVEL